MHKRFGILIRPETHTVYDVDADLWTDHEIRKALRIGTDEIVERAIERSGDAMVVSALLNATAAGKPLRCEGFALFGDQYYGPALIISGEENGICPVLDPHDISRAIQFFRVGHDRTPAERLETTAAG